MARTYAKTMIDVWDPEGDFRELTSGAQRLYWVLYSHKRLSAAGVMPLQPRQWAKLAKDTTERHIQRALDELEQHPSRKIIIDPDTEEVFVRAFIRIDGGANNPNILKAIRRAIDSIESETLRKAAECEMARALGHPPRDPTEDPSQGSSRDPPQGSSRDPPPDPPKDPRQPTSSSTSTQEPQPPPSSGFHAQDPSPGLLPQPGDNSRNGDQEPARIDSLLGRIDLP